MPLLFRQSAGGLSHLCALRGHGSGPLQNDIKAPGPPGMCPRYTDGGGVNETEWARDEWACTGMRDEGRRSTLTDIGTVSGLHLVQRNTSAAAIRPGHRAGKTETAGAGVPTDDARFIFPFPKPTPNVIA